MAQAWRKFDLLLAQYLVQVKTLCFGLFMFPLLFLCRLQAAFLEAACLKAAYLEADSLEAAFFLITRSTRTTNTYYEKRRMAQAWRKRFSLLAQDLAQGGNYGKQMC